MASHHHHHHHHHHGHGHCHNNPPPSSAACSCCCAAGTGGYTCNPQLHHPCPPPPPPSTDHLLHSELLLRHHKPHRNHQIHQEEQHQQTQFIISSLLQRIHTLESSLRRFSSPPPPPHHDRASRSLRDMAARIIQTHFRSHLVRRSRTLRQLQDLAAVKSSFVSLKSSLPSDTHFDSQAFSQKTTHLLLKLDSIQAVDPMIRVRKRAIGRELVRFLEFIDGVAVKRNNLSSSKVMNMKNVGFAQNSKARALREQREMVEKLRSRVEKIHGFAKVSVNHDEDDVELQGFHHASDEEEEDDDEEEEEEEEPRVVVKVKNGVSEKTGSGILVKKKYGGVKPKVKKNVSFAESACSDEEEENDVYRDLVENLQADIGRIESRIESLSNGVGDNEGSVQSSDEEKNHRSLKDDGDGDRNGNSIKGRGGSSLFSAPLPVKMEDRDDSPSRKFVKVSRV